MITVREGLSGLVVRAVTYEKGIKMSEMDDILQSGYSKKEERMEPNNMDEIFP